jgi:hypothetical protein
MPFATPLVLAALNAGPCEATRLETHGLSRVDPAVVEEVLPRALPTCIDQAELAELERRLWTLGIFDDVKVECGNGVLDVAVREKWTLIPGIDFGTAKTLRDSYFFVSLVESNTAGRAIECGFYGAYYERAFSGETWCGEHPFGARRLSFEVNANYVGSGFVFADEPYMWERRRSGGRLGMRLPFPYGTAWRFAVLPLGYHEAVKGSYEDGIGGAPPDMADSGWFGGVGLRAVHDAYEWHDLVPRGFRFGVEVTPGVFFSDGERTGRHAITAQTLAAFRFSPRTGLVTNVVGEAVNAGDVNHSFLLGSNSAWRGSFGTVGGVRGLPDNRNRDAQHLFSNVELRHSIELTSRLFLQGAAFADGGVYRRMNSAGQVLHAEPALSTGLGLRLLPTFLAWAILRVDGGRLWLPEPDWFVQFSFSQYL